MNANPIKPIKLTVGLGRTLSTPNQYESVRPHFSLEVEIEDAQADIRQVGFDILKQLESMIDEYAPVLIAHQTPRYAPTPPPYP